MKKCCLLVSVLFLLTGCSSAETFETVADEYVQSVMRQEMTVSVAVEPGTEAIEGASGTIYLCDGYEVTVEVMQSGNLSATLREVTGYTADQLTVIETAAGSMKRYECAFSSAGEGGDLVGRTVILDDGVCHYCVTVAAPADDAQALMPAWNAIFDSITLS